MSKSRDRRGNGARKGEHHYLPYDKYVEEAAHMVVNGSPIALEDVVPRDDEEFSDDVSAEEFREDVRQRIDDLDFGEETDDSPQDRTADPEKIDWRGLWDEFNVDRPLSRTQLSLALAVSRQTILGHDDESTAAGIVFEASGEQLDVIRTDADGNPALFFPEVGPNE